MKVLAVFFVIAVSFAASADGFVRQREVRDYMPKYGPYQHESDITEDVLEYAGPELNIIPTNAYFTLMETDPVTHESGYEPEDLTCGGEFVVSYASCDDWMIDICRDAFRRRAILATNEWLRALEPVTPWPELKKELDRYRMTAYEIDFWGRYFGALAFECPKKKSRLPILIYIPGLGEIGEDFSRQFHQRKFFDLVTSERFQKQYPCHVLALSPDDSMDRDWLDASTFQRRTYRMAHKVAKAAFGSRVDWSRLYLVGFSYGGTKVLDTLLEAPTKFAGGIAIAGMIPAIDVVKDKLGDSVPPLNVWYVANGGDSFVKDRTCVGFADDLKKYVNSHKGDFRVTYFQGEPGHNAWDRAWESEFLWKWLFSKKSPKSPKGK